MFRFIFVTAESPKTKLTLENLDNRLATMMMCSGHTTKISFQGLITKILNFPLDTVFDLYLLI